MAVFAYTATNPAAQPVQGRVLADSPREARDRLRDQGLSVHSLTSDQTRHTAWLSRRAGRRRVSRAEVSGFLRELATLLDVGAPMLQALDTATGPRRGAFRDELLYMRDQVAAGASLGDAMQEANTRGGSTFDEVTLAMTRVGEDAGCLGEVLGQIAAYHERGLKLKNRLASALIYPAVVLAVGLLVSVFLMTYVVPGLLDSLTEAGRELPWITGAVKFTSDLLLHWGWLALLGLIASAMALFMVRRHPRGRRALDRFVLNLPLAGDIVRKQAVVRLAFVLSTLMRSGVGFERAIGIAQRSTPNRVLHDALKACEKAVQEGRDLGPALADTRAFPDAVTQVFTLGQASGRLEDILDRLAESYDQQVATLTDRLTALLEPALIVVLAVVVGLIAFATVLPILEMGRVL